VGLFVVVGLGLRFGGFTETAGFCIGFRFQVGVQFFLGFFFDMVVKSEIFAAMGYAGILTPSKPHVD
jgi:hypothetical protein